MKKFLIAILVLGLLGGGAFGVYYYFFRDDAGQSERVSSTSEDAVYVDLVSTITGYGAGTGFIERYGGEVEPQATLEVKLENDRTVKKCFVKEGDEVKEGQKLFEYDTHEDEDKLAQNEIDIEKNKSDIEVSKKTIAQHEKDKAKASADAQLEYTTYILQEENSIKKAEYEIQSLELEIEQLKESIKDSTVTAEMAGVIQKISDPNNQDSYSYSGSDNNAYITILALGDYRIKGTANEQNYNQIYQGMPVIAHSRVDSSLTWKGTVTEIKTDSPEEEENNGYYYGDSAGSSNYAFHVELESSEGLILGQHVYLEEDKGQDEVKDGLWLEDYYIMQEDDHAYVWAASTSNVIEKREVTLGEYDDALMKYEITDGLEADDYIAYPQESVSEGDPVIYNDYSTAGAGDMSGDMGADDYSDPSAGMDDGMSGMDGMSGEDGLIDADGGTDEFSDDSSVDDGSVIDDGSWVSDDEEYYDADEYPELDDSGISDSSDGSDGEIAAFDAAG